MPEEFVGFGYYKIVEELGEGGFGTVYKAVHRIQGHAVAIKTLHTYLTREPKFKERFFKEAEIQADLKHPNIVTIYNFFQDQGKYYIVMEYLEGMTLPDNQRVKTLADLIKLGPLSEDKILPLFHQILEGVGYAHKIGVLHLDLKPSNILFTPTGEIKITDFGIARIARGEIGASLSEIRIGTAPYMSPEQILNKVLDKSSDIYSLGILLYEMATGEVPFKRTATSSVEEQHLFSSPPSLREKNPSISQNLEAVVQKALAKKPAERFQTCEDFLTALVKREEKPKTISVPSLIGKTRQEAEEILSKIKLNLTISGEEYSEIISENKILYQSPEPEQLLSEGEAVKIILSKGKEVRLITVPSLIGKGKKEAERIIADSNLKMIIEGEEFSDTIPIGGIIKQSPEPGIAIKEGEAIKIRISKGAKLITVPSLIGKNRREVEKILSDLSLRLIIEGEEYSEEIPQGLVTKQIPKAGENLPKGEAVRVILSKGKRPPKIVKVPSLIGRSKKEAEAIVSSINLNLITEAEEYSDLPEGKIIKQSPEPQTPLKEGESIKIILSKGIKLITTPSLVGKEREEAERALSNLHLKMVIEGEEYSDKIPVGGVIKQIPEAGSKLKEGEAVRVILSKGKKPVIKLVKVPLLIGKSLKDAEAIASEIKLNLFLEGEEFSEIIQKGQISRQSPEPGDSLKEGETIRITISKGREIRFIETPSIIGKERKEAERILSDLRLKLMVEEEEYSEEIPLGSVISQIPEPGKRLKEGEVVKVILSKGKKPPVIKIVKVPSLIGKSKKEAEAIVSDFGLKLIIEGEEYSDSLPLGSVLKQTPEPEKKVKEGDTIRVILSKGELKPVAKVVVVPSLVGRRMEEALEVASDFGLKLIIEGEEYSPEYPEGFILRQIPKAGEGLKEGEAIKVILSKEEEIKAITIPSLIGMDKKEAVRIISNSGLKMVIEGEEYSDKIPVGGVIKQIPEAGSKLKEGEAVRVILSKGKELVLIPSLIGKNRREVEKILSDLSLRLIIEGEEYSEEIPQGLVTKQIPKAGENLPKGEAVRVVLSKGKKEVKTLKEEAPIFPPILKKRPSWIPFALIGLFFILGLAIYFGIRSFSKQRPIPAVAEKSKPETTLVPSVSPPETTPLSIRRPRPETLAARKPKPETILASKPETIAAAKLKPETIPPPTEKPETISTPLSESGDKPIVPYVKVEVKPKPVYVPVPKYPEMAMRARIEGSTVVKALLETDGRVIDVQILKSSGNDALDDAALAAARQARFTPAKQKDMPVRVWVSIPFNFRLPR